MLDEFNSEALKNLIEQAETKTNGELDYPKVQNFLLEKLNPISISLETFYKILIEEMNIKLIEISKLIKKDFSKISNVELDYIYKILDIFCCINKCLLEKVYLEIVNDDVINNLLQMLINIVFKIISIRKLKKNNAKLNSICEDLLEYINRIFKVLLDINLKFVFDYMLMKNNNVSLFLQDYYSREIIYIMIQKIVINIKRKNNEFLKEKEYIIRDVISYLIEISEPTNLPIISQDIKRLSIIFKNNISIIHNLFLDLFKKIFNFYSNELKNEYENLFSFFFKEIIFEENINQINNIKYNKKFLSFLFDIYSYLIANDKKEIYEIFIFKLYDSMYNCDNKQREKIQENAIKKYNWLLNETEYNKIILNSFPIIFNETIIAVYFGLLLFLTNSFENNGKKDGPTFLPKKDLIIFFISLKKYIAFSNQKINIINFFIKKIKHLMNNNQKIIPIVFKTCNAINILIDLIESENDPNIQSKLFEFIDTILSVNKEQFEYSFNIKIRKEIDEKNFKINLISIGYEFDDIKYNEKLMNLIEIMNKFCDEKKIKELLKFCELIFKIIIEYKFKKIYIISDDLIYNLNNLLLNISSIFSNSQKDELTDCEKNLEKYIIDFLNIIFKYIFQINMKVLDYKCKKKNEKNPIYFTKRIIEKKILKDILKNMLLTKNNHIVKKTVYEHLINFSIDEKNNLILSSYIIYIMTKIYYQDKNHKNIIKLFSLLLNLIQKFELNAKILLNFDFITIILNILQEIYQKDTKDNDVDECYKTSFLLLEELCKFLNQELLMKYLNKLFIIFNKNVLNKIGEQKKIENENLEFLSREQNRDNVGLEENLYGEYNSIGNESYNSKDNGRENIRGHDNIENIDLGNDNLDVDFKNHEENENDENETENEKPNICIELFNLLKKYLKFNSEKKNNIINNNTSNYIILSNYTFPNHLINNLLFLDNLQYNNHDDIFAYFQIVLKINTYKGLSNFILLQLKSGKTKLIFTITDKKALEIKEKNDIHCINLSIIDNFDKILPADNLFHNCIIIINKETKIIKILIDNKEIISKSNQYKTFEFNSFNVIIGFKYNTVDNITNDINSKFTNEENKNLNDINKSNKQTCFIYISYLLILNTLIGKEYLLNSIKNEKKYSPNSSFLNNCYREKNRNWAKYILAEIDFQNKNIGLTYSKNLKNKGSDVSNFFYESNKALINRYIAYIETSNLFNDNVRNAYLYFISKNENIYEYYSLNNFCELENLNKSRICSKIFDNYDLIISSCNHYLIDFLIGFLFLIEKRFDDLKNNGNDNMENKNKEDDDICMLYTDTYLTNDNIIIDYIITIFEILLLIPSENIKNYFLNENSKTIITVIKYFFYRNISLLNDNEIFIERLFKIFITDKENIKILSEKSIFLKILIETFLNPIIFEKLIITSQNYVLSFLYDLLNKTEFIKNESLNKLLLKLVKNLMKIAMHNHNKFDSDEGEIQIVYIVNSIYLILNKSLPSEDKHYQEKMTTFLTITNKICLNFSNEIKAHRNKELYDKYNYIFTLSKNDENEENIEIRINKLADNINKFYSLMSKRNNISSFLKKNKGTKEIKCNFCEYLKLIFHYKFNFIYGEFKFDKLYKKYFRNYYLNFGNNSEIFGSKRYFWYLSLKESYAKIQNKLFLKENDINYYSVENKKSKKSTNYFIYNYGQKKYKKTFKELYKLSFIDKICQHENLINSIDLNKEIKNKFNCLVINKLHKILSIIFLYEDFLCIYYNLFLDDKNKINIVGTETTHTLWIKNQQDYEKELDDFTEMNEEEIKEEFYEIKTNKKKAGFKNISKFRYNKNYKFSKKIINIQKINEMYKRQHLHISNALEIFLNNGENYFIILNPENRDIIFNEILLKINNLYKARENKLEIYKNPKLNSNKNNDFYMKHCPIIPFHQIQEAENFIKNKKKKTQNLNFYNYKIIMDGNIIKDEISNEWSKNKITNYDYLMFLNTFAGRTFNDLSQYFIFPWIIKDFNKDILNWLSNKIYRDLSLPLHVCGDDKERIISKYNLLDDEKYHSGTFYSTHSFVCYFLVRQRPFTEIHLEIQGAKFDAPSRMFNGAEQLSNLTEKYQELIPAIFNLPELYIKPNNIFNDNENLKEPIIDYQLPDWSKNDPRKFTLILRKMLESDKISQKLNLWIDLIFGYKQKGQNAINSLNTFRKSSYPFEKNELEILSKNNKELETCLYEKEELGYVGKQLFTKSHKHKDINSEKSKKKRIFFNSEDKLRKLNILKINVSLNEDIQKFNKIRDIIVNVYYDYKKTFYQGGISSLPSIMNSLNEFHSKNNNINYKKIIEFLEDKNNYILLNTNYYYLYKLNFFLTYNKKYIELINIMENETYSFFLDEIGDISCLTTNEKGTKLYIGFSTGKISQYKITKIPKKNKSEDNCLIFPILPTELNEMSVEFKNIYNTKIMNNINYNIGEKDKYRICLKKLKENNFSYNNPHIPRKINLLSLNEYHNVLIALDDSNSFYILSLNNNYKLMHVSHFLSNMHYKMKEIIPLSWNGDFIIYSSYSINLFSINGIPLSQLNLYEKIYEDLNKITCCKAYFLYDIVVFTAHKNGYIIIWKIQNKNVTEKFEERISYVYNRKKSKFFLNEYLYGYNTGSNEYNKGKICEYELQRKFEIIGRIKNEESTTYINFMKMSDDLDYMILFDNKNNLYILAKKDDNKKDFHKSKTKVKCYNCSGDLIDIGIRPTLICPSNEINDSNSIEVINDENINLKLICEECKQKIEHTENFLYIN